jgi:hypothetical protein
VVGNRLKVVPPQLTAAAAPLRAAAEVLDEVADGGRDLRGLVASAPSEELRDAVHDCLRAYELATWELAAQTRSLAYRLGAAAAYYGDLERAVAHRMPHLPPRADMPPLRDQVVPVLTPAPRPAPAPVAPR